jgi:hypothetical protein
LRRTTRRQELAAEDKNRIVVWRWMTWFPFGDGLVTRHAD